MSESKTVEYVWFAVPRFDEIDWDENRKEAKKKAEQFRADFQTFWEKGIDMQKSSIDKSKVLCEHLYADMQDVKDSFAEFLPDKEIPFAPKEFSTPKKFRKAMKKWEKMAYDQFEKQADAMADFAIKSQEKACAEIPEVPEISKKDKKSTKDK